MDQSENDQMKFKSCSKCKSLNPVETKKCHVCNGEEFVPVYLGFEEDITKKQSLKKAEEVNWPELDQNNNESEKDTLNLHNLGKNELGNDNNSSIDIRKPRHDYTSRDSKTLSRLSSKDKATNQIYLRPLLVAISLVALFLSFQLGNSTTQAFKWSMIPIVLSIILASLFTCEEPRWLIGSSLYSFIVIVGFFITILMSLSIAFFAICFYQFIQGLN